MKKLKAALLATVMAASLIVLPPAQPAEAAGAGDCVMSVSYLGSYLTCDGTKKKVFTTIGPDRQISWGFSAPGGWVNVYTATLNNISARYEGDSFVCSMSWGGLCY